MLVQKSGGSHRHSGLCQALVTVAMDTGVHQLSDDGAIFGGEGLDVSVACVQHLLGLRGLCGLRVHDLLTTKGNT